MNFKQRSLEKELLDGEGIPYDAIRENMVELEFINRYLGGHQITISGLKKLYSNQTTLHVCEIGCGGGDNLAAIARWCGQKKISLQVTGIDWKDSCIWVAENKVWLNQKATWICSDYRHVVFADPPDIIFSSLFCHHFREEDLVAQLRWMHKHSRVGFFINDLHRHWLAYFSIKTLTALFSKSYLVKNDAPLSVARGFLKPEWEALLQQAGIRKASIQWKWAFRHLITAPKSLGA